MPLENGREKTSMPPRWGPMPWSAASLELWAPFFNGLRALNGSYGATMTAIGGEWSTFIDRRLKEDFALPQHLANCTCPDDAWRVYASFYQKAIDDYQKEFAELARIGGELAGESAAAFKKGLDEAIKLPATKH
jgi:hypothetical protein